MAGVAETGLGLKRGYVTGAVLLYEIIQEAKRLENELALISGIEKREAGARRADVLKRDEAKVTRAIFDAVEISEKLMYNTLEMLRRFGHVQVWEMEFNRNVEQKARSKIDWLMPYEKKGEDAVRRTVKILEDTANRAIGIKNTLIRHLP